MLRNDVLIGYLKKDGYLETSLEGSEVIILLKIGKSLESKTLEITSKNIGKEVLVIGNISADVLYSTKVVEILPAFSASILKSLLEKGTSSIEDLEEALLKYNGKKAKALEKKKLCALVIGHKKSSPGAGNKKSKLMEFDFNEALALSIEKKMKNVDIQRVYRRTYKELPDDINALQPDFIVSIHCNAYNTTASGTEVLYYHSSKKSKKIAKVLQKRLVDKLQLSDRGVKPKSSEDRGGYLLRYTNAPCIISEPFFIDNDDDLAQAKKKMKGLTAAYVKAIEDMAEIV